MAVAGELLTKSARAIAGNIGPYDSSAHKSPEAPQQQLWSQRHRRLRAPLHWRGRVYSKSKREVCGKKMETQREGAREREPVWNENHKFQPNIFCHNVMWEGKENIQGRTSYGAEMFWQRRWLYPVFLFTPASLCLRHTQHNKTTASAVFRPFYKCNHAYRGTKHNKVALNYRTRTKLACWPKERMPEKAEYIFCSRRCLFLLIKHFFLFLPQ